MKKLTITLIIMGMILGWITLGGTQYVLHKTSETKFCISCHSMQTPHDEWQTSEHHYSNRLGIQPQCQDCHIPHQGLDYLKTKILAISDVYHELRGTIPNADAFEAQRERMAKKVWADLKANDSATCRSCHNDKVWDAYSQSEGAQKMHRMGKENGQTCIECHKGVAHMLPDMTGEANKANEALVALTKNTKADAKIVYPVHTIDITDESGKITLGSFEPSTPLTVLANKEGKRQVQINGFQQQGAEQMVYGQLGQRLINAELNDDGVQLLKTQPFKLDVLSGLQWRAVTLTAWISDNAVLDDVTPIWDYAKTVNNAYCGGCHALIEASHFSVNQWVGVAKGMAKRTSMTDDDLQVLTLYFQNHAKSEAK